LVKWAEEFALDIKHSMDRPWKMGIIVPNPDYPPEVPASCCSFSPSLKMKRYTCNNNKDYLYLGQCEKCEAISFAYAEAAVSLTK